MSHELRYEFYEAVQQRSVEWLWYPYIPFGKITIVQGDPGEGKSTFMLNVAAIVSKGAAFPDESRLTEPITVVYQCSEDNVADTIKPRLTAAGADCSRVAYILEDQSALTFEDDRIDRVLEETHARLLILDPIQSFLAQDGDMQSASRMRIILGRLSDIAERRQCAIVLVGHLNKAGGSKHLYRGLGTIDIAAIARSVLLIGRDKDDGTLRYMQPIKSSLAPEGSAIAFSFDETGSIQWQGQYEVFEEELDDDYPENRRDRIRNLICSVLQARDYPSTEILDLLSEAGISKRTAMRVKHDLGVESIKKGNVWYWHLSGNTISITEEGDEL